MAALGFIARRPWLSRIFFNRLFRTSRPPRKSNALLADAIENIPPGAALDVTMGHGRNSIFLAQRGWRVSGFDVSDEALKRAHQLAAEAGVHVETFQTTASDFNFGDTRWDLVLLAYAWAPITDPAFADRLKRSVKPGGLVVFEHLLSDAYGKVPREAGAPAKGELARLFSDFEILYLDESAARPDWRPLGSDDVAKPMARMIARKPA